MNPRTKSSLLWGAVGAFAFLVLVQGFQLATDETVTLPAMLLVAVVVGAGATGAAYWLEGRLAVAPRPAGEDAPGENPPDADTPGEASPGEKEQS